MHLVHVQLWKQLTKTLYLSIATSSNHTDTPKNVLPPSPYHIIKRPCAFFLLCLEGLVFFRLLPHISPENTNSLAAIHRLTLLFLLPQWTRAIIRAWFFPLLALLFLNALRHSLQDDARLMLRLGEFSDLSHHPIYLSKYFFVGAFFFMLRFDLPAHFLGFTLLLSLLGYYLGLKGCVTNHALL